MSALPHPKNRGTALRPTNRFELICREADPDYLDSDPDAPADLANRPTTYIPDASRSVVTENDSPDVGFRYSLNPYRGCTHGCTYCYARPGHEYLGWNAGLDFETKILVKQSAPVLFREFLSRDKWVPEPITLSGVTDCYQPAERRFQVTRACLEVACSARQPISIVTKNALILRDLDLLRDMAALNLVHVNVSVTTLDSALGRSMEPRTSSPAGRLRAIRELSQAGVPVRVLVAPIIPGLTDSEIPGILAAANQAGAGAAGYVLLRLPFAVAPIFQDWLARTQPERARRVEERIRATREGKLNDPRFGTRMRGTGEIANQINEVFRLFTRRHGLDGDLPPYDCSQFQPPVPRSGQLRLF